LLSTPFQNDPDFINIIDIISRTYSRLPSEVMTLSWSELMICLRCIIARGERARQAMRTKGKNDMIFPTVSIADLIDII
jgi:hypothetical protein